MTEAITIQMQKSSIWSQGTHTIAFSSTSNRSAVILKRSMQILAATRHSVPFHSVD